MILEIGKAKKIFTTTGKDYLVKDASDELKDVKASRSQMYALNVI